MKKHAKKIVVALLTIAMLIPTVAMIFSSSVLISSAAAGTVVVNGANTNVDVTNNVYTFASTVNTGNFNHYTLTYESTAYVEGVITYGDNTTEQFFLEPSDGATSSAFGTRNGTFSSYTNSYLHKELTAGGNIGVTSAVYSSKVSGIKSIKFTLLDNPSGTFRLKTINTEIKNDMPATMTGDTIAEKTVKYFNNGEYKVGVDILNGGVISSIVALNSGVEARVYTIDGKSVTKVDYADKLDEMYSAYTYDTSKVNKEVNLINYYDNGRYLQQSYYGTDGKDGSGYTYGHYNGNDWRYNPVQGGNQVNEASKVVEYEITSSYIYIKARALDWAKWSDDYANKNTADAFNALYGDGYLTDTYIEAKYIFEGGMIKSYNRMVDYSGYPSTTTDQELPAFYTIEPLNEYVYNTVAEKDAWKEKNFKYQSSPDFWGVSQAYRNNHYPNGFSNHSNSNENWAAFMASRDSGSFGIGLYSAESTMFSYGVHPQIYASDTSSTKNDRHATTNNPAYASQCSYMAPIGVRTFKSYSPTEYSYGIAAGTINEIYNAFGAFEDENYTALHAARATISVPETIYMTPSSDASTTAQYYVNNLVDADGNVTLEASNSDTTGYVAIYSPGMTKFRYDVSINGNDGAISFGFENSDITTQTMVDQQCGDIKGYIFFDGVNLTSLASGLTAGSTATAEWKFTLTYADDSTSTHYAYSTLYAPNYHSVGATAESRYDKSNRTDGAGWISGIHDVSTATAPFGYSEGNPDASAAFKTEPLLNLSVPMQGYGWEATNNLTTSSDGKVYAKEYWVSKSKSSAMQSPVGILYVDYSRNRNTNTIPNVYVGGELLKADAGTNDSNHMYSFYTLGTGSEFKNPSDNDTPSGWTQYVSLTNTGGSHSATVASTLSSGVNMTKFYDIVRDANSGRSLRLYTTPNLNIKESGTQYIYAHTQLRQRGRYANMYSAVEIITVDKGYLRELVLKATSLDKNNYTTASWNAFYSALQSAASALGNPTNIDIEDVTTNLKSKMDALQTTVTLNANGGTLGSSATFNVTVGADLYFDYDLSGKTATHTGYTLVGWSTDKNAATGSTTVRAGLMPTIYAIWEEGSYTIVYNANGGSGTISNIKVKLSESFALASSGFTRDGYSLIGWSTSASATTATYSLGQTVSKLSSTNGATVTLYAVWKEISYTVVYNANGGSGSIASKTVTYTQSFALASSGFTKAGHTWLGWSTNASAATADYQLGQTVSKLTATNNGTVTLYAIWTISDDILNSDVVVVDFGSKAIEISPVTNDTDFLNAAKDGSYQFLGISSDGTNYKSSLPGSYGSFAVNGEKVTYTPATVIDGVETVYYHVSVTLNGKTTNLKETITVAPASNVLYEENFFKTNAAVSGIAWAKDGTTLAVNQDSSTANDVYGYDSKVGGYNQIKNYSNGSALIATVTENTKTSNNATFTFDGTGFDLNGVCGPNTGVLVVSLKNNDTNKMVKSYIIDTYYGDANYGTLYQVPVITDTGRDHANYTVQVVASWLPSMSGAIKADKAKQEEEQQKLQPASVNGIEATVVSGADNEALRNALAELGTEYIFDAEEVEVVWFDDNSVLNGGMGVNTPVAGDTLGTASLTGLLNVIDSVRVYNPIENGNDYYIESEKNAAYYNVIENLSKANGGVSLLDKLFAYITGKLGVDENGKDIELTISNYESVGPKDELYLAESTSVVAFKISNFAAITGADGRVMISLRAASGTPKLKIGGIDFAVNSNTEMYYDITDYISDDGTVTLQNTSTDKSLLAIGYLKTTCPASAVAASISSDVDLETVKMMMMAPSVTVEPNTTPTPEEPAAPEIPATPEDPAEPEDPASECWLVRIFKWIFNSCVKIFNVLKGFLAI